MKLGNNPAPVEMSGGLAPSEFSIAMNAKAFRVLSDSLYQNKIGSIVREISCNAYDSHIMANKESVPFEIHLPDSYEPWFSVQDFGIGLSPQDIFGVFTKYFESTKDQSNATVGAFGLGCKSPFSYTDQFTVTSTYNGMKRIYSAFITEQGIPSLVEMEADATTDPNGVEIRMSAKREDFQKFATEVSTQLRFFKTKPKILNKHGFAFKSISNNLIVDNKHVAICNDAPGYGEPWAHIIQGNVGYPLDLAQVREKISKDNVTFLDNMQGSQVRFYFNIGEIGVTASREGVEYNKVTIASIDSKLTEARKALTEYINKKMAGLTRDYDKAAFLNSSAAVYKLANAAGISLPNVTRGHSKYYFDFSKVLVNPNKKNAYGNDTVIGTVKRWVAGRTVRENTNANLTPNEDVYGVKPEVHFVLRDTNSRPNMRAKHYLDTHKDKVGALMEIDLNDESGGYTDAFIQSLKDACGGFDKIVKLSTIELPVVIGNDGKRVKTTNYNRPTYYQFKHGAGIWIRQWERCFDDLEDMDDDYVYVAISDMSCDDGNDHEAIAAYNTYSEIETNVPRLIAIRQNDTKKVKDMPNFVKLQDYIKDVRNGASANIKARLAWRRAKVAEIIDDEINRGLQDEALMNTLNKEVPKHKVTRFVLFANKHFRNNKDLKRLVALGKFMGWDKDEKALQNIAKKVSGCYEVLEQRYPLIAVFNDWSLRGRITPEHLAKYLTVM